MCKGGSKTVTGDKTSQKYSQSHATGYTGGSDESLAYARDALSRLGARAGMAAPLRGIAEFNPYMLDGLNEASRIQRGTTGDFDEAGSAFRRAGQNITAADIESRFNPYSSYVEEGLNRDLGMKQIANRVATNAVMGGVGGDRAAVSEALNRETDQLARGKLRADLYDRAYGMASADRANQYNFANALQSRYAYAQGRGDLGAQTRQGRDQAVLDALYAQSKDQYGVDERYANAVRGLAPVLGMQSTQDQSGSELGLEHKTETTTAKEDPWSKILGLAMSAAGAYFGMPMGGGMGKGAGGGYPSAGGRFFDETFGGGTGFPTNPWSSGGIFGGGGAGWGRFARGGRVPFAIRKQAGGPLSWNERSEPIDMALRDGIFVPRYEENTVRGGWPPSVPEGPANIGNFNDRASPHIAAIDNADYDPQGANYTDFRGRPAMEASNAGVIPLPAPRPDDAGPRALPPPEMAAASPYAASSTNRSGFPAVNSDGYDIDLPPEPKYSPYRRPERNWAELLLRAGLATLAHSSDRDNSGVPTGALSHVGKGFQTAFTDEQKEREAARKESETENYNIDRLDNARMRRLQMQIQRQNAIDANEERAIRRAETSAWRESQSAFNREKFEETKRKNAADEARKEFIARSRDEQIRMGKPFSDDNLVYKAQVRADNWRKSKVAEINAGIVKKKDIDLDDGWQKVYNETFSALKQAQQDAISRMRRPAAVAP